VLREYNKPLEEISDTVAVLMEQGTPEEHWLVVVEANIVFAEEVKLIAKGKASSKGTPIV
jgi:hypothetical protein